LLPSPRATSIREIGFAAVASFGRFGIALWAALPRTRTTWDFHRSDSLAIVRRRNHQTPRFNPMGDPDGCRNRSHRTRTQCVPHASAYSRPWRFPHGRNVIPPSLIRPGPSVTVGCPSMLAAYPAHASSRRIFRTVTVPPG
jgi:hypothetical protein